MSMPFPHRYAVTASVAGPGLVHLTSPGLPPLNSQPPAEFDGPGDQWSPETFLVAAVADCFILTFRGVARATAVPWTSVTCRVEGTLDRVDHVSQFTSFVAHVALDLPSNDRLDAALRALHKAEQTCLISNSLKAAIRLQPTITVAGTIIEPAASAAGGPA